MALPQTNATLLSVQRGGFTEDYDRPAGTNNPIWQGTVDAYVQRKVRSNFNDNGELVRVLEVTLFLPDEFGAALEPGDTVVYQAGNPDSPVTLAGRVQTFTDPAYLPQMLDYYKVALEEINVP